MGIYSYTARGPDKKKSSGVLVAESEQSLGATLAEQGLSLIRAQTVDTLKPGLNNVLQRWQGVPVVQKIFFTQNLGVMLRGGFSISRAMATLALQTNHKYFKKVILSMQQDVEGGIPFAQTLRKFPHVFSEMFINMIAAGEVSGKLDDVLKSLTIQMKKDHQLASKVKGAMTYPIVVVVAMIGAAVAMVTFVIPRLLDVFDQNGAKLPLPTRILIAVSNAFQHQGIWIALGTIALVAGVILVARTKRGQWWFDTIFLVTPILSSIIKKVNLARFTRSLSSMLSTDIPIIQAFQVIGRTLSSPHYRQSIDDSADALRTGATIAKVLEKYPKLYPPLVQQMVNVGEESGTLDEVSAELAVFYEEDVDQTMANLSTIIEPVLLLFLGAGVAGMAVAILLPMYSLSEQIN
ncbi:MAG: type II secretion system F family protein [Candidatus Kerfeldbacteria bacterium]|nr:type II secretion system F family protein [Candidatus Kerfeldbacteria bacterium]